MRVLDLFSGIGGFSLGLEKAGFETVAFCEIEEYPRKVLNKHWPGVPIYNDVRKLTYDRLKQDGIKTIDIICGGFPCQDISVAGNQKGIKEGTRSGLWSECARLLGEVQPKFAIFENVTALLNGSGGDWFKRVLWDISKVGYDAEWHCISASEFGAHHHRDRIWIIAYAKGQQNRRDFESEIFTDTGTGSESKETPTNTSSERQQRSGKYVEPLLAKALKNWKTIDVESSCISGIWKVEPKLGRVADGIPNRAHRLKALGNAVVPQIPELIGRAIMEVSKNLTNSIIPSKM